MDSYLAGEIDKLGCFAGGTDGGFDDCIGRSGDCDDGAIVGRIERPVQQAHSLYLHGSDDLLDLAGVRSFGEVGDTFDDGVGGHGV